MASKQTNTEGVDLKKAGLKVTHPRVKILHIMENSEKRHLGAEEIYKSLLETGEDVGLATVYRVLTQFESAGLVIRHHFEEGHSVYEVNQGEHHDHILCVKCGRVDEFMDSTIEERQIAIARRFDYEITDHYLNIYGVCPDCRKKKK